MSRETSRDCQQDCVCFLTLFASWIWRGGKGLHFFKSPTDLFIYPSKQLTCKKSSESDKEQSMPTKGTFDDRSDEDRYDGAHDLKHRDQTRPGECRTSARGVVGPAFRTHSTTKTDRTKGRRSLHSNDALMHYVDH